MIKVELASERPNRGCDRSATALKGAGNEAGRIRPMDERKVVAGRGAADVPALSRTRHSNEIGYRYLT